MTFVGTSQILLGILWASPGARELAAAFSIMWVEQGLVGQRCCFWRKWLHHKEIFLILF